MIKIKKNQTIELYTWNDLNKEQKSWFVNQVIDASINGNDQFDGFIRFKYSVRSEMVPSYVNDAKFYDDNKDKVKAYLSKKGRLFDLDDYYIFNNLEEAQEFYN